MVALIEVFTLVSTFADAQEDDLYKITLVELGALQWSLDLLYSLKSIVDMLESANLFNNQQVGPGEETKQQTCLDKHPFAGFNSRIVALACTLTYRQSKIVEDFFMSQEGKLRLGTLLSYTKIDVDNPTLREWCLMVVRNLCSWSEKVQNDLKQLELIEVSPAGQQALLELGLEEVFRKEIEKLNKKNKDGQGKIDPTNIHFSTVDF